MMAYVDANGQITMTPPEDNAPLEINLDDIQLGAAPIEAEEAVKPGLLHSLVKRLWLHHRRQKQREYLLPHQ